MADGKTMLTRDEFEKIALRLYEFCEYPAVRYNIMYKLLGTPYDDPKLDELRPAFLSSDIVEELYQTQGMYGNWGSVFDKDYSVKAKIPTTAVGIDRCLYIGLTLEDRDILFMAKEFLEGFLDGSSKIPLYGKNERAIPWQRAGICNLLEDIQAYNELCDKTYLQWLYIAERTFEDGEYSYERERDAQHEVFLTREARLIPMQFSLILKRREKVSLQLEEAMLHTYGEQAYREGYFWRESPERLPEIFKNKYMSRWFYSFNQLSTFRGSGCYLDESIDWLLSQRQEDGLWDWGSQVKDPWGYFKYFSCTRNYTHNRIVNASMEVLSFMKKYMDNNSL